MQKIADDEKGTGRLIPMTVRFSEDAMSVFDEMAEQHGRTKADIIRLTIDNRLEAFLQKCVYVEHSDAVEIRKALSDILTEMQAVRSELHRIGINFNQELKLKQIAKKYSGRMDYNMISQQMREEEEVKKDVQNLSREELDALLTRYEKATERVGDILCLIQE